MAAVIATLTFRFAHPWWLLAALLAAPLVVLAWRNLAAVGRARRIVACLVRALVVALLAVLLADPLLGRRHDAVALVAVLDRSLSLPPQEASRALAYLAAALERRGPEDRLAVINAAEMAMIERLPTRDIKVHERVPSLTGEQTDLAAGLQLGLAIAPPEAAVRMLLVSDGNETAGDVREAARIAAANGIPVDVLPVRYEHAHEVFLKRLVSPPTARSGQTVALRFVLASTASARGRLHLSLNGQPVDLDPASDAVAADVDLKPGTNVKTISMPVGTRGLHEFEATFVPDGPGQDTLLQNNKASSMTYVAGPGHVLVVDEDGQAAGPLVRALQAAGLEVRRRSAAAFPQALPELLDTDAVMLVNTSCGNFTYAQQELLCHFVRELGGGLVMVGGPQAFGAGGWIGSPVAEVLPVDVDPPQKKQMPKGALVLVMHSCEMPMGNYWGKEVALAAVGALSRLDLAGVISYGWGTSRLWDYPLGPVGDKRALASAIKNMQMGDMPDFGSPMQEAYDSLAASDAAQKHVIMISDGDPAPPSDQLLGLYKLAGITCTGVAVYPHGPTDIQSLVRIAQATGGRFHHVTDPNKLPQIFVKEAQTVKRALISEEDFRPRVAGAASEIVRGLAALPGLGGYVLTGPKGGAAELVLAGPEDDPILAAWQVGVGRCVAFTSSADSRWAGQWLAWGGFNRFWEQAVRWAAKSRQSADCTVFADVQGRDVTVTVEALDREGRFVQYAGLTGRLIGPDMAAKEVPLIQVGPGTYRGSFKAGQSGSYLMNLRYEKAGAEGGGGMVQSVIIVPYAPEYRDLADNAALLAEIARETGGRIIGGPAEEADLFSRRGLKFPETPLGLGKYLMMGWVALFLVDVASRRLAVEVRAAAGRMWAWMWRRGKVVAEAETVVAQLQRRTRDLRRRMGAKGGGPEASRRFEAPKGASAEMPDEAMRGPAAPAAQPPAEPGAAKPAAQAGSEGERLDRLLKAKRRAVTRPGEPGHQSRE
jgi:uncharacterized membrane protein